MKRSYTIPEEDEDPNIPASIGVPANGVYDIEEDSVYSDWFEKERAGRCMSAFENPKDNTKQKIWEGNYKHEASPKCRLSSLACVVGG